MTGSSTSGPAATCRSSIWSGWYAAPWVIRAASASTPPGPTARRARWSMSAGSISLAGARARRWPKALPRHIAGILTMSRPSIGAPSPDAELATDHLTQDLSRRSRRGGAVLLSAQVVRVMGQMATLVVLAPLLARFYGQPELEGVARWLALAFVASGLTVQHWALLRRQMRFGVIAGMETTADLVSFGTAIALAVAGAGYWALVAQRLVSPILLALGSWA